MRANAAEIADLKARLDALRPPGDGAWAPPDLEERPPHRWRTTLTRIIGRRQPGRPEAQCHIELDGDTEASFRAYIDICETTHLRFSLEGWAFFPDQSVASVEAHLLGAKASQSQRMLVEYGYERGDVRDDWKNVAALHSGFRAHVPLSGFRPRKVQVVFTADNGSTATVTADVVPIPVDWPKLIRAVWAAATPENILVASKWLIRGDARRLVREILALTEAAPAEPRAATSLSDALGRISPATPAIEPLDEPVDIIIPVYNGLKYLKPLFTSLKRNTTSPYRLIVVEDCGSDKKVKPALKRLLAKFDDVVLIENETNKGFVKSVNIAAGHVTHDFVLLNTDTVVPPQWLERLMAPIRADRAIASTTPFSNAATICSFPEICKDNTMLPGLTVEQVDGAFRRIRFEGPALELPSGVGFCMGVNRDVWQEIGTLDEASFELGYGEENDWCLRAAAAGYRNIMVEDLFVQHDHGGSFESEKKATQLRNHLAIIQNRYPSYQKMVDDFIRRDEPAESRRIAALLIAGARVAAKPVLIVDHDLGGGATTYRTALIDERAEAGQPVFLLVADGDSDNSGTRFRLRLFMDGSAFDYTLDDIADLDTLFDEHVALGEIFYNNLVSYRAPLEIVGFMTRRRRAGTDRLRVAMHDFYPLCPSYTLLSREGSYCGLPDIEACKTCLARNPYAANPAGDSIESWRGIWGDLLEAADEVLCFSEDSRRHLLAVYPACEATAVVQPHALNIAFARKPALGPPDRLGIAVVGGISHQKGSQVVERLARHLAKADPSARITVIGTLNGAPELPNLTITGRYEPARLPDLLEAHQVNVCLLPAIWPETFSYVTAELMALDMPIVAFDIGAPAERLRDYARGRIVPITSVDDPTAITKALRSSMSAMGEPAPA